MFGNHTSTCCMYCTKIKFIVYKFNADVTEYGEVNYCALEDKLTIKKVVPIRKNNDIMSTKLFLIIVTARKL